MRSNDLADLSVSQREQVHSRIQAYMRIAESKLTMQSSQGPTEEQMYDEDGLRPVITVRQGNSITVEDELSR